MTTIVTRAGKGSALTHNELDTNFTNLNTDKVEASGDSMTGDLSFGDNNKAVFGAGSDLQIYHDGSNSYVEDAGAGALVLNSNQVLIKNADSTETLATFNQNSDVVLRYDNAQKLATTATGIDVTGTVTADGLTVDGTGSLVWGGFSANSSGTATVGVRGTTTSSLFINTASVNSNYASGFGVDGTFSSTVSTVNLKALGVKDTGYSSQFKFSTTSSSTEVERLRIANNGDVSLFEDTGTTAKFFWDASAESLCLNNSNSTARLVVAGTRNDATIELLQLESASDWVDGDALGSLVFRAADPSGAGSGIKGSIRYGTTGGTGATTYMGFNVAGITSGTNDTERMRITNSGNVGIGTTSPAFGSGGGLEIERAGASTLRLQNTSDANSVEISATASAVSIYGYNAFPLVFGVNNAERARIDSSGNLLVGKTSAGTIGTAGIEIRADDSVYVTRNGNPLAYFNRLTSDGDIVRFQKDSTTVGSIGANVGGALYIDLKSGSSGIRGGNNVIVPNFGGSDRDDLISLGVSGVRFKDLYLSGGVYLGGTTSNNLLHDYESDVGAWSPVLVGSTSGTLSPTTTTRADYVKVGDLVHAVCYVTFDLSSHSLVGNISVSGLPFSARSFTGTAVATLSSLFTSDESDIPVAGFVANGDEILLVKGSSTSYYSDSDLGSATSALLMISINYKAT